MRKGMAGSTAANEGEQCKFSLAIAVPERAASGMALATRACEGGTIMKRVLSIGQCGADHGGISRTLQRHFGAEVVAAHTPEEGLSHLREGDFALVLVNRVLDADGSSGLDVVKQLKADEELREVPVMLVSNYEDAQE